MSHLGALPPPPPGTVSSSAVLRQPDTISADASIAARHLRSVIDNDTSASALRPTDATLLDSWLAVVSNAIFSSVNARTKKKDETAWRYWTEFAAILGTTAMRSSHPDHFEVNVIMFSFFIFWLAHSKMRPRDPYRRMCKPASIMGNVYGVLRTLRYHGRRLDVLPRLGAFTTKLTDDFAAEYGYETLAPRQREPFTNTEVTSLLSDDHEGATIRSRLVSTLHWSSWFGINLRAAIGISKDGGFRLAEWTGETFDTMKMSRACLFYVIGGQLYRCPSPTLLRSMAVGDRVGLLPGAAKNDRWGLAFFNHPLWFNFADNPTNTAWALRELDLHCPCSPALRRSTPLLSYCSCGDRHEPIPQGLARAALQTLMADFPSEIRKLRSWHAFRVRLACLLLAANASDSVILALLRWKSPKSLLIYARRNPADVAAWLDRTLEVEVSSVRGANLPSPTATIPNALTAPTYEYLFQAQATTATDAVILESFESVRQMQLDGSDFVEQFAHYDMPTDIDSTAQDLPEEEYDSTEEDCVT